MVGVIVRELSGSLDGPERAVERLGGEVGRHISIIDGFVARVPAGGVELLEDLSGIHSVTPDARVTLLHSVDGYDALTDLGSMHWVAGEVTGAGEYWNNGFTGQGVDVALIDSGVTPVDGLTTPGKVINGPDLSFEGQADNLRYLDSYGHGTHMAGIIAGRDNSVTTVSKGIHDQFLGMAPGARVVSVKVAGAYGATDVSQVLAAIDWVVQNKSANGMNIRVLNLSFGTDGVQSYQLDPLAYAAEVAWRKGIVVVVAAGNGGYGTPKLNNRAYDPFVLAVGASDGRATYSVSDDVIPSFSSTGDGGRNPDLVAPGKSIVSLKSPGSYIDETYPAARAGARYLKGSGTSQAAAVVSGAAALVISQRPSITPNQVKKLLTSTAQRLPVADSIAQGAGLVDLKRARDTATPSATSSAQAFALSTGLGSLEAARGTHHVADDNVELVGANDILGPFDVVTWSANSLAGRSWSNGAWNGRSWSGNCWCSVSWSGSSWSGRSWSGSSWSGRSWSGRSWSGRSWSGRSWSAGVWDSAFLGRSWSGNAWSSSLWGG